jgi:D-xylulose reductase
MYNVCKEVRFWATPPYHEKLLADPAWAAGHGCLRPSVVHPAAFTFKLPDHVSHDEGAMVEPLAVGMHACTKAKIKPGDVAVVIGAGPIGMLTAMAALASGCAKVFIADSVQSKVRCVIPCPVMCNALCRRGGVNTRTHMLPCRASQCPPCLALSQIETAETLAPGKIHGINVSNGELKDQLAKLTDTVEVVIECSGNAHAASACTELCSPGGTIVWVGCPTPFTIDIGNLQVRSVSRVRALCARRSLDLSCP